MGTQKLIDQDSLIDTIDLRRGRSRDLIRSVADRAKHLPPKEQALLNEVYAQGKTVTDIAKSTGETPSYLRRKVRKLTARVLDPRYRYVTEQRSTWRPTRRQVAEACVIEGLSIKEASDRLQLSQYVVRKHREAIETMYEAAPKLSENN